MASFYAAAVHAACDIDEFPVMPEMRTFVLMDKAQYNSETLSVLGFDADVPSHQLVNHYQRLWAGSEVLSDIGQWLQISTITKNCILTVQYRANGADKTTGRLVASAPIQSLGQQQGEGMPIPPEGIVISDLTTQDGPKTGRLLIISSEDAVIDVASYYRTKMQGGRWLLEREFEEQGASVQLYRDGLDEFNLVIIPTGNGMSQILINEVTIQ
jgi:hypothetical protein